MTDDANTPADAATSQMTVLIVGGYGTFGGRFVELLSHDPRLELIVSGRSFQKAKAFCARQGRTEARLTPLVFDRNKSLGAQLGSLKPDLIVDASGPFQIYGDISGEVRGKHNDPYRLVRAAIAERINYVDLADAADFVANISALHEDAASTGTFALSGLSTCPALTCAVVRALAQDLEQLQTVTAGIAPSPHAVVGSNVIEAVASYSGQKTPVRKSGKDTTAYPFTDSLRYTITVPGRIPLRPTHFSLVDAPDLQVIPQVWPDVQTVWLGAGPTPEILHRILNALAWLVRWRILPGISRLAPVMNAMMNKLRWGPRRGGMFVHITGIDEQGKQTDRAWHLIAEGNDGPYIPSMAAAALIRKLLNGYQVPAGARAAHNDLALSDFAPFFAERQIATHVQNHSANPNSVPLYRELLQGACDELPAPIQTMHDVLQQLEASGTSDIVGASNPVAAIIARVFRFPKAATAVPVHVTLKRQRARETWTRTFGEHRFHSTQEIGRGRNDGLLVERFGPFAFGLAVVIQNEELHLIMQRWQAFAIPMPRWAAPRITAFEAAHENRFHFNVALALPVIGTLVEYRGWLTPKQKKREP